MRRSIVTRVHAATLTVGFHRLEMWASRGGLIILGIGIFGPIEWAKNVGFGLIVISFVMNIIGMITRRFERKDRPSE